MRDVRFRAWDNDKKKMLYYGDVRKQRPKYAASSS